MWEGTLVPAHEVWPRHDRVGRLTRAIEIVCLVVAGALLLVNVGRLSTTSNVLRWWTPLVLVVAAFSADLVSGMVHWTADTWGSATMPILGQRFLRPFRIHHVNPGDFLRRDVIDCNGDVAMLNIPLLTGALLIPVTTARGWIAAAAVVAFSAAALPTNQVHQWAHMPAPPPFVRWLQRHGLILSRDAHARHHAEPYALNYCIATGWCNRWLTAIDFFGALERGITALTGWQPRADEHAFISSLEVSAEQPDATPVARR